MIKRAILSLAVVGSLVQAAGNGCKIGSNVTRESYCTSVFQSYFDGCWQVYLGGTYTDEETKGITSGCVTKGKAYTKKNDQCKDVKFDDEP